VITMPAPALGSAQEQVDGDMQARFMERALAESARLRREASKSSVSSNPVPPAARMHTLAANTAQAPLLVKHATPAYVGGCYLRTDRLSSLTFPMPIPTRAYFHESYEGRAEKRDQGRNMMAGGAQRMAELLEEHNAENFGVGAPKPEA